MIIMYTLLFINIVTTLSVCFVAGAIFKLKDDIDDRLDELSMIETQIVSLIPDEEIKPEE